MKNTESEEWFAEFKRRDIKKLTDAGFSKEQAESLIEVIKAEARRFEFV